MSRNERLRREEHFHDAWANAEDVESVDVFRMNEAVTAPEMRFILNKLGDLTGRSLLDIGCGLGEASVYFAIKGARVTGVDISAEMLAATRDLARRYGVEVDTVHSSAEDLGLPPGASFDVIYAANLFHHVDIGRTLAMITPHLNKNGILVSWDPIAYNPLINIYRRMATNVRTEDEHPLRIADIKLFRRFFHSVETNYFWLTTLAIFIVMALIQRRDPNRERYWKKVVEEGDTWAPLYRPLELLDRFLLACFPFLRLLCWNVVIVARAPQKIGYTQK